jgi:glycosyltransferase involved in cell wall biosynthesis
MNILITHFQIQDWGGIVNYSEFMARGLKALGHTVQSVMLKNKGVTGTPKTKDRSDQQGWEFGEGLGLWMHQKNGWDGMYQLNYHNDRLSWEEWSSEFDLILHHISVPTCSKATKGDDQWIKIFNQPFANQLAVVHDGNMKKLYPHILNICDKIDGVVCVHDAAFHSCEELPIRRAFIPNPHEQKDYIKSISNRDDAFVSLQTFKRWKRVDDLIRAIPYMDDFSDKYICGGGIEYHYMTSKEKVKPCYLEEDGSRIWENALSSGMEYLGYVTTSKRDELLADVKLLIDPSWSLNYSKLGCHFNRVMVEAMAQGCVPVCTDLAMKNSFFFKSGINYIEIPYNSSPQEYAKIVDEAMADEELLSDIQENNLKLMEAFDKVNVAKAIIEFSESNGGSVGIPSEKLIVDAARKMEHFDDF